ncbi:response regulator transcription factor [Flammeovirga kamogawensis]|uniref:Response regulator transcription factor n=1 Tax=Flammeovirga kamogawensis TaxID=373891 RepID=A0ABX8GRY0_9BACT|nr:response regulator transcription factor [Flammeovirga kamogawensis]MBB6462714.1 DNA-binding NarL/FixJ family response regulator [Flammeovirga kamogawensis]QWG06053.1 response regulator transcription factor [Flammeovirga kamogawensis]TRX67885.1 response regulator transcription factor [Flammeovirga kamogawensis]
MSEIKILLVDDHSMIRFGLKSFLEDDDIVVTAEAKNGIEALELLKDIQVDVVVTDIMMPEMDGIVLTQKIMQEYPNSKVLALTMMNESQNIKRMLSAGAKGYLLKDCTQEELIKAIKMVNQGEAFYSNDVTQIIMQGLGTKPKSKKRTVKDIALTEREIEVLHLICKEKTNAEIAEDLFITLRTVEAHKRNLLEKTGCKNVAGLVLYAIERSLFDDL